MDFTVLSRILSRVKEQQTSEGGCHLCRCCHWYYFYFLCARDDQIRRNSIFDRQKNINNNKERIFVSRSNSKSGDDKINLYKEVRIDDANNNNNNPINESSNTHRNSSKLGNLIHWSINVCVCAFYELCDFCAYRNNPMFGEGIQC